MEVGEPETQDRRPDIKPPPTDKAVSGPQATEGGRRALSPTPGSHLEEAINKRYHSQDNWHEARAQEYRRRKSELRDLRVSRLRGPALE